MITNKDLYKEQTDIKAVLDNPEATALEIAKAQLKASDLTVKLLHNLRTNMVSVMDKFGVEKVKPKVRDDSSDRPEKKD